MLFTVWVSLAMLVWFVIIVELQSVSLCPRVCGTRMVSIHRHLCVWQGKGAASGGQEGGWSSPVAANGQLEALLPPLNTSFTHRKLPTESRRPVSCIHTQQNTQRGKKQMIACILSWAWTSIKFNNQASKCSIHGSKTETVMNHVDGIYKLKRYIL